jgi:hypothetical protein
LWVSLPDDVLPWVDEKRNRLSVDRTLKWLDQCLSLQNVCSRLPFKPFLFLVLLSCLLLQTISFDMCTVNRGIVVFFIKVLI